MPKSSGAPRPLSRKTAGRVGAKSSFISGTPAPLSLSILLVGLMLAGYNLSVAVNQSGAYGGLMMSWEDLLMNYGSRRPSARYTAPIAVASRPTVMFSVTDNTDRFELNDKLVEPMIAHYAATSTSPSGILIEKKNRNSAVVKVRLFFMDHEEEFLWPGADNAVDGIWVVAR